MVHVPTHPSTHSVVQGVPFITGSAVCYFGAVFLVAAFFVTAVRQRVPLIGLGSLVPWLVPLVAPVPLVLLAPLVVLLAPLVVLVPRPACSPGRAGSSRPACSPGRAGSSRAACSPVPIGFIVSTCMRRS